PKKTRGGSSRGPAARRRPYFETLPSSGPGPRCPSSRRPVSQAFSPLETLEWPTLLHRQKVQSASAVRRLLWARGGAGHDEHHGGGHESWQLGDRPSNGLLPFGDRRRG